MISSIQGLPFIEEPNPYAKKESKDLGRDEFLKLFLAQLKHQDPLNPMEGTEFSSQLAQFSSLEQLFNMNETLESINESQNGNNAYQVIDLIGKEVEAKGDMLSLVKEQNASAGFSIRVPAESIVMIIDQNGYRIREMNLGVLQPGAHTFEWDGRSANGELMDSGVYNYKVTAISQTGELTPVETRVRGVIDRINLDGAEPLLFMGEAAINLSQIINVNMPKAEE